MAVNFSLGLNLELAIVPVLIFDVNGFSGFWDFNLKSGLIVFDGDLRNFNDFFAAIAMKD